MTTRVPFASLLAIAVVSCGEANTVETVRVSLVNSQSYEYPTVGGDEEGARISVEPQHASVSEIRRDAGTNWVATFVYQPTAGYVGVDRAEIEIFYGSDGASPGNVKRVVFHFDIHD
jgi:hypothetical protein